MLTSWGPAGAGGAGAAAAAPSCGERPAARRRWRRRSPGPPFRAPAPAAANVQGASRRRILLFAAGTGGMQLGPALRAWIAPRRCGLPALQVRAGRRGAPARGRGRKARGWEAGAGQRGPSAEWPCGRCQCPEPKGRPGGRAGRARLWNPPRRPHVGRHCAAPRARAAARAGARAAQDATGLPAPPPPPRTAPQPPSSGYKRRRTGPAAGFDPGLPRRLQPAPPAASYHPPRPSPRSPPPPPGASLRRPRAKR